MSRLHHQIAALLVEETRGRHLSKGLAAIVRDAVRKDDPADLIEWLPKAVAAALEHDARQWVEGREADAEFEATAAEVAASDLDIERELDRLNAGTAALSRQALAGLDRMGSGTRPTAAAVAGAAVGDRFHAQRLYERAIELRAASVRPNQESEGRRV